MRLQHIYVIVGLVAQDLYRSQVTYTAFDIDLQKDLGVQGASHDVARSTSEQAFTYTQSW